MSGWRYGFLLLVCLGLLGSAVRSAEAQTRLEVRAAIQATDLVLARSEKIVAERRCERGVALLARARELQEAARGADAVDDRVGLRAALARTRQARNLAREAADVCQVETQAVDQVRSLLDATRDLSRRAEAELGTRNSVDGARLLEAGRLQLERAENAYRKEQLQLAVSHATVARRLLERALADAPRAAELRADPAVVAAELAGTDAVLAELRGGSLSPRRQALFDQAVENQEKARASLAAGRSAAALEFSLAARRLGHDLLREVGAGLGAGSRVERALQVVETSLVELEPDLLATEDPAVGVLVEQAREAIDLARAQLAEERFGPAAASARLAGALLREAAETAGMR